MGSSSPAAEPGDAGESASPAAASAAEDAPERPPPLEDPDTDEEGEEALTPKMARDPSEPTKAEWEAHQSTHLPFRIWCPHCVAGRSDNPPHRRAPSDKEQPAVPEVHMDYAYVRRESEEEPATILIGGCRMSSRVTV